MLICGIKRTVKKSLIQLQSVFPGEKVYLADSHEDPYLEHADLFVQTNLIKRKFVIYNIHHGYEFILNSKKPKLVLESPMFRIVYKNWDRSNSPKHIRFGWNSYLYDQADYNNKNSPPDRWHKLQKKFNIENKDWKKDGEYILFLCQKPGDSSMNHLFDNYATYWVWLEDQIKNIRKITDRPIVVRPHILQQGRSVPNIKKIISRYKNVSLSKNIPTGLTHYGAESLHEDFKNAHCAVTFNSLAGVDAVLDGVPLIALDGGCMALPVAHTKLTDIENLNKNIDKTQWLYDSAYTQWDGNELATGEAWEHLKPNYKKWKLLALQQ